MRIIPLDADREPLLDPDLLWDGLVGDLAITSLLDPVNPGGFRSEQALATAVLICLMTDVRVDATELPKGQTNRGWPGDAFDRERGETPLGSKLWLLRRRALTEGLEVVAQDYARQAMQTLINQGAAVRCDVTAVANRPANRLDLNIVLFGRDGTQIFNRRFGVLWDQANGVSDPLAR